MTALETNTNLDVLDLIIAVQSHWKTVLVSLAFAEYIPFIPHIIITQNEMRQQIRPENRIRHCGVLGWATVYNAGIPYGHRFKTQLLYF